MKKIMITAALVASLISLGYSQNRPQRSRPEGPRPEGPRPERSREERQARTPEERAKMATDALEKKLNLTSDQKDKVYALNLDRAEKMEKTMKSDHEFRKSQMEKQKAYMAETDKKLNKILTAEQQKSYEDMKKQSRERIKARHQQRPGNKTK